MDPLPYSTLCGELPKKKKTTLLTLRIDEDLDFAIDCYCLNHHGEQTKSQFIREAIKARLELESSPKYVEPKIPIPKASQPAASHDAMKSIWLQEEEADRIRQRNSQER